MLQGPNVALAPLDTSHVTDDYVSWFNTPETFRFLGSKFPQTLSNVRQYVESISRPDFMCRILLRESGLHVGNLAMQGFSAIHRRMELGIVIGDASARGRGLGREASSLAIAYAFGHLNLHKVTAGTVVDNAGMTKVFLALGFEIEGTLKQHYFAGDGYRDYHVFGVRRAQFKPAAGTEFLLTP
jgi:[ribosomal protein S5]-alanine N-acetyltransferase